jgi:hypothetical protein
VLLLIKHYKYLPERFLHKVTLLKTTNSNHQQRLTFKNKSPLSVHNYAQILLNSNWQVSSRNKCKESKTAVNIAAQKRPFSRFPKQKLATKCRAVDSEISLVLWTKRLPL